MNTPLQTKEAKVGSQAESPDMVKIPQEQIRTPEPIERAEPARSEATVAAESEGGQAEISAPSSLRVTPVQPKAKIDRLAKEIESILSENLTDIYLAMPPDKQQEFKTKGEETASKVRELVRAVKVNAKKIFQLIRDWMKIIPGVNRFFLEQEAKIKTDKILLISEEEQKQHKEV